MASRSVAAAVKITVLLIVIWIIDLALLVFTNVTLDRPCSTIIQGTEVVGRVVIHPLRSQEAMATMVEQVEVEV